MGSLEGGTVLTITGEDFDQTDKPLDVQIAGMCIQLTLLVCLEVDVIYMKIIINIINNILIVIINNK